MTLLYHCYRHCQGVASSFSKKFIGIVPDMCLASGRIPNNSYHRIHIHPLFPFVSCLSHGEWSPPVLGWEFALGPRSCFCDDVIVHFLFLPKSSQTKGKTIAVATDIAAIASPTNPQMHPITGTFPVERRDSPRLHRSQILLLCPHRPCW